MPVPKGFREEAGDYPSSKCAPKSFRVKILSETKRIIVCCPQGSWSHGRCSTGMKETKMQTKIAGGGKKHKKKWGMYGRKRR